MWNKASSLAFGVIVIGILFLAASTPLSSGRDKKPEDGKKPEERIQLLEQRLAETEKKLVETLNALKELQTQKAPRHQMLNAGQKVIILDTQTGTVRVEVPDATRAAERYQPFVVGNSLFIADTQTGTARETKVPVFVPERTGAAERYQPFVVGNSLFIADTATGTVTQKVGAMK